MAATCSAPATADKAHRIKDGARRIDVSPLAINWGDADLRDNWQGTYSFCSFACLAAWAREKSAQHDGVTITEGT